MVVRWCQLAVLPKSAVVHLHKGPWMTACNVVLNHRDHRLLQTKPKKSVPCMACELALKGTNHILEMEKIP